MAENPSGTPSDDEMLQALARHLSGAGGAVRLDSSAGADLSWHSVLDCRIRRTTETRKESARTEKGRKDLSALPTYSHLAGYRPGPPAGHGSVHRIELVREGSVRHNTCECGNGEWACKRCEGRGRLPCDPTTACPDCRGLESCAECDGTGKPRPRAKDRDRAAPATASRAVPRRVRCAKCRRPGAACPTCAGRGRTQCSQCTGTGLVDCPKCTGGGTVAHDACGGSGVVTTWVGAVIEQRSREELVRRPLKRPPFPVRRRTARLGRWRKAVLTGDEALPGDLDATHAEALVPHLVPAGEVHRRIVLRHLPLARITVPTDPDRVFYAFPGSDGIEVLGLPSSRRVARGLAIAAAALVVVVLLLSLLG
ncbi:hypothetical protein [Actinacidiphila glaucinigra]|uniref:hypothetical protein n=1 Tax=Actinacidiphila glaucinigra TaxID=235986 RepID=UPI003D8A252E